MEALARVAYMSKAAIVTQAQISRAIRAALQNGLRIKAINPIDGTITIESDEFASITPEQQPEQHDWSDR
jgi:hypothetical protein